LKSSRGRRINRVVHHDSNKIQVEKEVENQDNQIRTTSKTKFKRAGKREAGLVCNNGGEQRTEGTTQRKRNHKRVSRYDKRREERELWDRREESNRKEN